MLLAVAAGASWCLGTDAYAAAIDGRKTAPWPAPRANEHTATKIGDIWCCVIQRKGRVLNIATIVAPTDTARQLNLSVKYPSIEFTEINPRPMGASVKPALAGEVPHPAIRKRGTSICPA